MAQRKEAIHRVRDAGEFGKVAVLMGGLSAEREISLQSGRAVLQALLNRTIDAHPLDTAERDSMTRLEQGNYARAFIVLHGRGGEDGVIQGALEVIGVPYTGSGVLGSALAMDKIRSKRLWQGMGLPTPPFCVLQDPNELPQAARTLGFPVMMKPAREGSSIGMTKVGNERQMYDAFKLALEYDRVVLAERWINGSEYTAAVLGTQVLPLIRLHTPREFYDYEAKYLADTTEYHCPCGLPEEREQAFQALALQAFDALGAAGWGRVDFMVDEHDAPWLIEVNTVPGMTDHSLVPMAARAAGIEFDELVWQLLEGSVARALPA